MRKLLLLLLLTGCVQVAEQPRFETVTYDIFSNNMIHYSSENPSQYETVTVSSQDDGREIRTELEIPKFNGPVKITAKVNLRPIPKDLISVHDKWDRAGHVRLVNENGPDVELLKFMTAYGGTTEWEMDVSHLASLLVGNCEFAGWIDTWVTPAWYIDFTLTFEPGETVNPTWAEPLFYDLEYRSGDSASTTIDVPELGKIEMYYLVSGHCSDGTGADEFEPKDNVFYCDDSEIHRFRPWRTDCKQFRAINPYTRRWSNGIWSSDFSRSGWCPGDAVSPTVINLDLEPGTHDLKLLIEDIRPEKDGHYGYWRVSAIMVGWN
jgi:hypothetical protein